MRHLVWSAGVVFVFSSGASSATVDIDNPVRFDDLIRQGRAAFLAFDPDRAESAYNQACPAELVQVYPVAKSVMCENLLASVDEVRGNLVRAEQRYLHAAARAEQAGKAYQPLYCAKLIDLGSFFHRRGRLVEAEASLRRASDLARQLTPGVPELLPKALIRLGSVYSDSGDAQRGRAALLEALALAQTEEGSKFPNSEIAFAKNILGKLELAAGNQQAAEAHLRDAALLASVSLGEDHPVTVTYRTNLAMALIAQRQFDGARLLLRRAQFVLESRTGGAAVELAVVCAEMSDVASSEGKLAEAEDYAQRAISILSLQPVRDAVTVATAQVTLSGIYLQAHQAASAEKILPQAIEIQRAAGVRSGTLAVSLQLLAELRFQQRNWKAAEADYREAIELYRADTSANQDRPMALLLGRLAEALKHEGGQKNEIRELEGQAQKINRSIRRGKFFAGVEGARSS